MVAREILEMVAPADSERTLKAVQGLTSGAYRVEVVRATNCEVQANVINRTKTYATTIATTGPFCSCPDAVYRRNGRPCKHAVMVALVAAKI